MKFSVVKQEKIWWTISAVVMIASIAAMIISFFQFNAPLRPGLDFIGGTKLQLELDCNIVGNCDEPITTNEVTEILLQEGLGNSSVQVIDKFGLSIRTQTLDVEKRTELQNILNEKIGQFNPELTQIDTVGPTIGAELFRAGILALIVSFLGIVIYLTYRFQLDYALFAIVALFHDALFTAGVFAVLGLIAGVEVDSLFLVALLTIVGFSVNDTVVIYDRIRETIVQEPEASIDQIVDDAVNQTLTRSINTSLTTVLPVLAIFLFGGETLKYFALALMIGFIAGSYSSIFVASTLWGWWRKRQIKQEFITNS
jgi:preprotein translocase subunit SecF